VPGLTVLFDSRARADLAQRFSLLQRHAYKRRGYLIDSWRDACAGIALGRLDLGVINRAPQPLTSIDGRYLLVAQGEIRDCDRVRQTLNARGVPLTGRDHADVFLATYVADGAAGVASLNGSYFLAVWDRHESTLTLVSDRYASRPHVMARLGDRFYLAPDIAAIREARLTPAMMDLNGVAACLAFEYPLGDDTNIAGIQAFPAATIMRIHADGTDSVCYWKPFYTGGIESRPRPRAAWLEEATERFKQAIRRSLQGDVVVTLSGGTDTRLMVAFASRFDFPAYTFGHPRSDDVRLARRVAAARGLNHHLATLRSDYLITETPRILELGEGLVSLFHAHNSDGIDEVAGLAPTAVYGVTSPFGRIEGVDGILQERPTSLVQRLELLLRHAWHGRPVLTNFESHEALTQRVFASLWQGCSPSDLVTCFDDDFARSLLQCLDTRFAHEAALIEADGPEDWLTSFGLVHRQRRFTQWGLKIAGTAHEVRKAFDDYELTDFHLRLPAATRRKLVAEVIKHQAPDLARIPRTGSGVAISASWPTRAVGYGIKQMKRYRHAGRTQAFADPQALLRHEAKQYFEDILLDTSTLNNGFFNANGLRELWRRHQSGERQAASALLALVTFELWRRQLRLAPRHAVDANFPHRDSGL